MKLSMSLFFPLLSLAAACSGKGDSGLESDKTLSELSAEERASLCTWELAEIGGPAKETTCADGSKRVNHTQAECEGAYAKVGLLTADACKTTVEEVEACVNAMKDDACGHADACTSLETRVETCGKK